MVNDWDVNRGSGGVEEDDQDGDAAAATAVRVIAENDRHERKRSLTVSIQGTEDGKLIPRALEQQQQPRKRAKKRRASQSHGKDQSTRLKREKEYHCTYNRPKIQMQV